MFKYLLIKLSVTNQFDDIEYCEYCQVIRENYSLSQIKYKYYVISLYGVFKKKLSRYIVSKILDDSIGIRMNYSYTAKDDTEFLNRLVGTPTVVNSYIIL